MRRSSGTSNLKGGWGRPLCRCFTAERQRYASKAKKTKRDGTLFFGQLLSSSSNSCGIFVVMGLTRNSTEFGSKLFIATYSIAMKGSINGCSCSTTDAHPDSHRLNRESIHFWGGWDPSIEFVCTCSHPGVDRMWEKWLNILCSIVSTSRWLHTCNIPRWTNAHTHKGKQLWYISYANIVQQ